MMQIPYEMIELGQNKDIARTYNPTMAMWFSAMFTFQFDNTKT